MQKMCEIRMFTKNLNTRAKLIYMRKKILSAPICFRYWACGCPTGNLNVSDFEVKKIFS